MSEHKWRFKTDFDWRAYHQEEVKKLRSELNHEKKKLDCYKEETKKDREENWKDGFKFGRKSIITELIKQFKQEIKTLEGGK